MARDYKSRAAPKKKKTQTPGWVWFLGGLLVGVFASGLVWLKFGASTKDFPGFGGSAKTQVQQELGGKQKPTKKREPEAPKPRFDFYTILPEMEVVVPDPEPQLVSQAQAGKPGSVVTDAYMLQMGSFRKYADADRLKASLALVGIEAEIQKVNVNGSDTFHRVRSGPYGREQVNTLRARLKQNNINSLVIKLKQ